MLSQLESSTIRKRIIYMNNSTPKKEGSHEFHMLSSIGINIYLLMEYTDLNILKLRINIIER